MKAPKDGSVSEEFEGMVGLTAGHPSSASRADPREAEAFLNHRTEDGERLGECLARFADAEYAKDPSLRPRCHDCAFLRGTEPNAIAGTLMNALKCVMEREPFYCHVIPADGKERLCAGWEALLAEKDARPATAPWDYSMPDPNAPTRMIPEPPADGLLRATNAAGDASGGASA